MTDYGGMIRTDYLSRALRPKARLATIKSCTRVAEGLVADFKLESIVVSGWSGALIGGSVADALGLPLTIVRKRTRCSHASDKVEGYLRNGAACLFLDDIVSSGDTYRRVNRELGSIQGWRMSVGGVLLYHNTYCNKGDMLKILGMKVRRVQYVKSGTIQAVALERFRR